MSETTREAREALAEVLYNAEGFHAADSWATEASITRARYTMFADATIAAGWTPPATEGARTVKALESRAVTPLPAKEAATLGEGAVEAGARAVCVYNGEDESMWHLWVDEARTTLTAALPHLTPPAPSPSSVEARALSGEHVGRTVRLPDGTTGQVTGVEHGVRPRVWLAGTFGNGHGLAPSDVVEFVQDGDE